MDNLPPNDPPQPPHTKPDALPTVEPPSASFILQLFVIPLVIVTIIVMVWLMFSWLAHVGSDPRDLVRDLRRLNDASWQRALTLAELLRNPEYDQLKHDARMASELADVLQSQLAAGKSDDASIRLRMFLCKALGEFRVPDVLPALVAAARQENSVADVDVRRAALQGLAVFLANNDVDPPLRTELMDVLREASKERAAPGEPSAAARDELRSNAAFALGVLGDEAALERLRFMLADPQTNVRYNAALGLARHGDLAALPVLQEMLDPENELAAQDEPNEFAQASKRLLVIKNGIRGTAQLSEQQPTAELVELQRALETIISSDLERYSPRVRRGIRLNAEEVLIHLRSKTPQGTALIVPARARATS